MNVTRDVINDLWPVYSTGEASADTRALVDAFLQQDPEFARQVRADDSQALLEPVAMNLRPDHEMETLMSTRKKLIPLLWPLNLAIMFSCFAFGRIVADTSWDVSPRNFIITAAIAGVFWVIFVVSTVRRAIALR